MNYDVTVFLINGQKIVLECDTICNENDGITCFQDDDGNDLFVFAINNYSYYQVEEK